MKINPEAIWAWVSAYSVNIIGAILIFVVGKWLARRISRLLSKLLKDEGKLICMTSLYSESTDFDTWYYKNDPTHVFIYQKETLDFIVEACDFDHVKIRERLIVFSK